MLSLSCSSGSRSRKRILDDQFWEFTKARFSILCRPYHCPLVTHYCNPLLEWAKPLPDGICHFHGLQLGPSGFSVNTYKWLWRSPLLKSVKQCFASHCIPPWRCRSYADTMTVGIFPTCLYFEIRRDMLYLRLRLPEPSAEMEFRGQNVY